MWLAHYMTQFPKSNAQRLEAMMKSAAAKRFLSDRQRQFFETGIFRQTNHGRAEILAIRVQPWLERVCRDLRDNMASFERFYALDKLEAAHELGLLIH